jgi:membrane protease YdiL (CAAX protease family)
MDDPWGESASPHLLPPEQFGNRPRELARLGSWPVVIGAILATQFLAAFVALPLLMLFPRAAGTGTLSNPYSFFLLVLVGDLALVGFVYILLVSRGVSSWSDMGLAGGNKAGAIVHGIFYGVLFILISGGIGIMLQLLGVNSNQASQYPLQQAGTGGRIAIWLAGVVLAPVSEEIFFRGYVFRAMSARKGFIKGLIFSSCLFALVHLDVASFLPLAAGAAVLAIGYRRTGSLWTSIVAHALNNAFAFALLMLSKGGG